MRLRHLAASMGVCALLAGCGGNLPSRESVRIGDLNCTLPGEDVRREVSLSSELQVGRETAPAATGTEASTTAAKPVGEISGQIGSKEWKVSLQRTLAEVIQLLKDKRSIAYKRERLARLSGRAAELDVITFKLCEAAGNGLLAKAHYEEFLRLGLQSSPGSAY